MKPKRSLCQGPSPTATILVNSSTTNEDQAIPCQLKKHVNVRNIDPESQPKGGKRIQPIADAPAKNLTASEDQTKDRGSTTNENHPENTLTEKEVVVGSAPKPRRAGPPLLQHQYIAEAHAAVTNGPGETETDPRTALLGVKTNHSSPPEPRKPDKRSHQDLQSGTHIRRRPPSVSRQTNNTSSTSAMRSTGSKAGAASNLLPRRSVIAALGEVGPGDLHREPGKGPNLDPVHRSRSFHVRQLHVRVDASPTRPPRGGTRRRHGTATGTPDPTAPSPLERPASSALESVGVGAVSSTHGRPPDVNVGAHPPTPPLTAGHGRRAGVKAAVYRLTSFHPAVAPTRADCESVLRCYLRLCEAFQQTPNEHWVETLSQTLQQAATSLCSYPDLSSTNAGPAENESASTLERLPQPHSFTKPPAANSKASSTTTLSGISLQRPAMGPTLGSKKAPPNDPSGKAKEAGTPPAGEVAPRSTMLSRQAKESGKLVKDQLLAVPTLKAPIPMSWPRQVSTAAEVCIKHVLEYCEQQLKPFRNKMDVLHQHRTDVRLKLEKFIEELSGMVGEKRDTEVGGAAEPAEDKDQVIRSDSVGKVKNSSRNSSLDFLRERAQSLNEQLHELQQSLALLLLCLEEYAKEVKKPLGSAWNGNQEDHLSKPSGGLDSTHKTSSLLANSSSFSKIENSEAIEQVSNASRQETYACLNPPTRLSGGSTYGSVRGESGLFNLPVMISTVSPSGFARFVIQQEKEILEELNLFRATVRATLIQHPLVHIPDMAVFDNPFFYLPSASDSTKNHCSREPTTPLSRRRQLPTQAVCDDTNGSHLVGTDVEAKSEGTYTQQRSPRLKRVSRKAIPTTKSSELSREGLSTQPSGQTAENLENSPSKLCNLDRLFLMEPSRPSSGKNSSKKSDTKLPSKVKVGGSSVGRSNKPKRKKLNVSPPSQTPVPQQFLVGFVTPRSKDRKNTSSPSKSNNHQIGLIFRGYTSAQPGESCAMELASPHVMDLVEKAKSSNVESPHNLSIVSPGDIRRRSLSSSTFKPTRSTIPNIRSISSQPKVKAPNSHFTHSNSCCGENVIPSRAALMGGNFIFCSQLIRAMSVWQIINASFSSHGKLMGEVAGPKPPLPPARLTPAISSLCVSQMPAANAKSPTLSLSPSASDIPPKGLASSGKSTDTSKSLHPVTPPSQEPLHAKSASNADESEKHDEVVRQQRLVALAYIERFLKCAIHRRRLRNALIGAAQVTSSGMRQPKKVRSGSSAGKVKRSVDVVTLEEESNVLRRERCKRFLELLAEGRLYTDKSEAKGVANCNTASGRNLASSNSVGKMDTPSISVPAVTSRERFHRARQLGKGYTNGKVCGEGVTTHQVASPNKRTLAKKATLSLPLLEYNISTKRIATYNKENEGFMVSIFNRLLAGPLPLIYTLAVLCERYPVQPPMGYAPLKKKLSSTSNGKVDADTMPLETQPTDRGDVRTNSSELSAGQNKLDLKKQAQLKAHPGQLTEARSSIFTNIPFSALRPYLMRSTSSALYAETPIEPMEEGQTKTAGEVQSSDVLAPSLNEHCNRKREHWTRVLWSVRYESHVDAYELRHANVVPRPFIRPFERWGTIHNLIRRISCAAGIYAWKILFSHTMHDDLKQTHLHTTEERIARLERVRYRNQMILECYDVYSEREWLREASKDLSFVGRISVPRDGTEKKDPYIAERCKQTFDFVEKFILQCFPAVDRVDHIPRFLLGAGIYFLIKEVLNCDSDYEKNYIDAELFVQRHPELVELDGSILSDKHTGSRSASLTPYQLSAIQVYEQAVMLSRLTNWFCAKDRRRSNSAGKSLVQVAERRAMRKTEEGAPTSSPFALYFDYAPQLSYDVIPATPTSLVNCFSSAFTDEGFKIGVPQRHVETQTANTFPVEQSDNNALKNCLALATGIRLVHVPESALRCWARYRQDNFLKGRELEIRSMLSSWFHTTSVKKNETEQSNELLVLYSSHFLKRISTQIAYVLLGVTTSLDMCEDLECVEE